MSCAFFKDGGQRVTKVKEAALAESAASFLCFNARIIFRLFSHPILPVHHACSEEGGAGVPNSVEHGCGRVDDGGDDR